MNKKDYTVQSLFSTPVYVSHLNRLFNKKELNFFKKIKKDTHKILGNTASNNKYLLDEPELVLLKKELNLMVKQYFDEILSTTDAVKPFITQSWLNYTETNQYHHKHSHPNSIVSGVLYIDVDEKHDKIKFFNESYKQITLEIKNWNMWNSASWWFPVKIGELILFPSSLTHMVETKEGDNTRVSLAFNVFVKGKLGSYKEATELII